MIALIACADPCSDLGEATWLGADVDWEAVVEEYAAASFDGDECSQEPQMAVARDECAYRSDPVIMRADCIELRRRGSADGGESVSAYFTDSYTVGESTGCGFQGSSFGATGSFGVGEPEWPGAHSLGVALVDPSPGYFPQNSYASLCLEAFPPRDSTSDGPADWRGVAFFHGEHEETGEIADYLFPFDHADWVYAEDSSYTDYPHVYCTSDADGIDNDYDGIIDEPDTDGDGIIDCEDS